MENEYFIIIRNDSINYELSGPYSKQSIRPAIEILKYYEREFVITKTITEKEVI